MSAKNILDDEAKLSAYLSFGYLPAIETSAPFALLENASAGIHQNGCNSEKTAVSEAAHILTTSTQLPALSKPHTKHVVLLSGGHDSRAILGSLLQFVDRTKIVACTYGYPGNKELETATRVAKVAGIEHHRISVEKTYWSTGELINSAKPRAFPPSFLIGARFQNHRIYKEFGTDCTFWDGILGDALTGAHLKQASPFTDWQSALEAFIRYNRIATLKLAPPGYDPLTALPAYPLCSPGELAFDDQLDIAVRQTCYIANRIPIGYTIATPYSQEKFWRFWMSLPRDLRQGQIIYREALLKAFPRLFSIRVTSGDRLIEASPRESKVNSFKRRTMLFAGRAFRHSSFYTNAYRKIGQEMRDNISLRNVMSENIADLTRRKLLTWLDASRMWSQHLAGITDHGEALRILVSLEIALKIAEMDHNVASESGPADFTAHG